MGTKMETVIDFVFLGSKISADSDCSHEIKRLLFLERKAMTNLDSVLKSRDKIRERWRRNRMGRPLSPLQVPQKNISTLSKLHETTSVGWQRTSGNQKSRPLSSKTGRKKYKRRERRQRRWGGSSSREGKPVPGREF